MTRLVIVIFCFLLSACATAQGIDEHAKITLGSQPTIYRDQWVRTSAPEIHIQPASEAVYPPKVLFLPFRVTQDMENPKIAGYSIARTIWQTWLSMQLFPTMEFSGDDTPYRRDRAVMLGKQRGADMVIGGFVTYLYSGGTVGDTQVSLQIEGIDVATGQTVWSLAQGGVMPATTTSNYIIFAVKHRMPSDPVHAVVKAIGIDTGKVLQSWLSGPPKTVQTQMEKIDKDVHDTLFPERNQVPKPRPFGGEPEEPSF